ncbi:MAG: hypothetical protein KC442_10295 [Thermomicrobiales bacterium]|nr:hypothetical protein [Thermomicrobiales bacterium]
MTVHVSNQGPQSFAERINRVYADLRKDGVAVSDMRRSPSMELQFAGAGDIGQRSAVSPARAGVEPVEGPIVARRIPEIAPRDSRLRYFLDGAQRTFSVLRCGLVPVAATVVAAGVLRRDPTGDGVLEPGTLALEHSWLIPSVEDATLAELRSRIEDSGMRVIDTLTASKREIAPDGADFGLLHELAYIAARDKRAAVEREVLDRWTRRLEWRQGTDWIVVDGRLTLPDLRTIGLVKQFTETYLSGQDAITLLGLPPGYRTTAFFPGTNRHFGEGQEGELIMWYIRLWDADGLDARHALVRIEAPASVATTDEIDEISAWILAERTPRATGDARWATLLYPVHLLERMLKRRLDADTRGWPGA